MRAGDDPAAVKQAIFEGRSALLRCREGRDQACGEIQRILSDGDGRIARTRAVRAHLRSCAGCREFRGALARRPRDLALLLPPLPGGAAAALLHGLFEGPAAAVSAGGFAAGLAAKAAIVVAIAGAGAGGTVALHSHAELSPFGLGAECAGDRGAGGEHRGALQNAPRGRRGPCASPGAAPREPRADRPEARRHTARPAHRGPTALGHAAPRTAPSDHATPPGHVAEHPPLNHAESDPIASGHATSDPMPPSHTTEHTSPGNGATIPPSQAKKQAAGGLPPGQAKKQAAGGLPPGQAKKQAAGGLPPGQAKKQAATRRHPPRPPGQAKKQAATPPAPAPLPPGQAKK